jgi:hypothetical protein
MSKLLVGHFYVIPIEGGKGEPFHLGGQAALAKPALLHHHAAASSSRNQGGKRDAIEAFG